MPDRMPVRVAEMSHFGTLSLAINGTDMDGDAISYRLDLTLDIITLAQNDAPNSATLHINATGAAPGAYSFKMIASDGTDDEWAGYAILIAEEETWYI